MDHPVGVMPRGPLSFDPAVDSFWVFGYGSIVWKVGFEYEERVICCAPGFRRRFYQGSTDHRGTVERPGRTVTLERCDPNSEPPCWGAAYKVSAKHATRVLELLETREKQYDARIQIDLFDGVVDAEDAEESSSASRHGSVSRHGRLLVKGALTYVATPDEANLNWLGAPAGGVAESAAQIAAAVGPSGPNAEYLFNLCDAMRNIEVDDPHVFELEEAVRAIMEASGEVRPESPGNA
jgi:cation transport protein ChaC